MFTNLGFDKNGRKNFSFTQPLVLYSVMIFNLLESLIENTEQVRKPGPRIPVLKIKMVKNEVVPWQETQDPISIPKVDA